MTTNVEREALRECPFCGGEAHWCPTFIDRDTPGTVECANGCGATVICSGPKSARIAAWNKRASPASDPCKLGEVVAYRYVHLDYMGRKVSRYGVHPTLYNGRAPIETHPLYAAPPEQPAESAGGGEVEQIVAWLRSEDEKRPLDNYLAWVANRIERGDHRTGSAGERA